MNIVKQNDEYRFFNEVELLDKLPKNSVFEVDWNAIDVWLTKSEKFVFPDRMYDIDSDFRKQVKQSYKKIGGNIGVLLCGYKGQGKSITAKQLCQEIGDPVILLTRKVPMKIDFSSFISNIKQDIIIFIDEFEKLFEKKAWTQNQGNDDYHSQESFLTLTDGIYNSEFRRLFVITSNQEINDKFISRPTRIRYYKSFNFMEQKLYDMIIEETLVNKEFEEDLRKNLPTVSATVDLLKCIIEEINVHNKPYSSFASFFNFRPSVFSYDKYELSNKASGTDWLWRGSFDTMSEITAETNYIDGSYCKVTDISAGYIYYSVSNTENNIRGRKYTVSKYRLKRVPIYDASKEPLLM